MRNIIQIYIDHALRAGEICQSTICNTHPHLLHSDIIKRFMQIQCSFFFPFTRKIKCVSMTIYLVLKYDKFKTSNKIERIE